MREGLRRADPPAADRGSALLVGLTLALAAPRPRGRDAARPAEPTWTAEQRQHWSFVPPTRPEIPRRRRPRPGSATRSTPSSSRRSRTAGLAPAPEADRATLIRRLRFDLTGLPPSPARSPPSRPTPPRTPTSGWSTACSPRPSTASAGPGPGSTWPVIADSDGFKNDKARPNAWRYRDWVVEALNDDMPYDRFLALQLAGDEIAPGDPDAFIATGFNRNWPFEDNNMVPGLNKQLILDDMTDTTSSVVLGLTVACARCHDHKYDPISQRDYYRLQALFAATKAKDDYVVAPPEDQAVHASMHAEHEARVDRLRRQIEAIEQPYAADILKDKLAKLPAEVREGLRGRPADPVGRAGGAAQEARQADGGRAQEDDGGHARRRRSDWQGRKKEMDALAARAPAPCRPPAG